LDSLLPVYSWLLRSFVSLLMLGSSWLWLHTCFWGL